MATITLRNVPDELHRHLKEAAKRNRRSLNQEAIERLRENEADAEAAFLAELAEFRAGLAAKGVWVTEEEVDRYINEGRD